MLIIIFKNTAYKYTQYKIMYIPAYIVYSIHIVMFFYNVFFHSNTRRKNISLTTMIRIREAYWFLNVHNKFLNALIIVYSKRIIYIKIVINKFMTISFIKFL